MKKVMFSANWGYTAICQYKICYLIRKIKIGPTNCEILFIDLSEDPKSRSGSPDEVPVVPASSKPEENICPICHEEFDQFYKQDFTDFSSSEGKYSHKLQNIPYGTGIRPNTSKLTLI